MKRIKKYAPFLVFLAAMFWATDAPFRVHLTKDLSSNFIVLGEHFFDILVAIPVLLINAKDAKKLGAKEWLAVFVIAIGGSALASIAFTQSFRYVNPSVAILLQKLQPLIAITLAAGLLKEKLNPKFWVGALVAIAGAYIISFPNLAPQVYAGETFNPNFVGVSLALIAAILWGASTVLGKMVLNKTSFATMTSLRFVLAFVFLLILNVSQHSMPELAQVTGKDWLFLFIIAWTSGVASLFIYYKGLQYTRASVATIAELGFPLAAVVINAIFLNAALQAMQILGMAILFGGLIQLSRFNLNPYPKPPLSDEGRV